MTREEKIDWLCRLRSDLDVWMPEMNKYKKMYKQVLFEVIEALSEPTKTEPKWISVDKRLPENFQRVLVTIVNYNGNKVVRVAEYYGRKRIFQIKENNNQWEVGDKGLLAWRPLPEPYKAESEHKRTIDADELLKRIAEKCKIPSLSKDTVNGLCGATAIIFDMLNESGQEK